MTLTITRVAHSTTLLDFDGETVLTDPWYSEKAGYHHGEPYGIALANLPRLTGVVVSHNHYDHYDMASFAAYPDKDVPMVVKSGMADAALKVGFRTVTEVEPWQSVTLAGIRVTAAPGAHSVPENCYVLEGGGYTVFFGGDSLYIHALTEVAQRFPSIDLALLPVNGLKIRPMLNHKIVMTAEDAADLCAVIKPRTAVPIHYAYTAGFLRDHLLLKYDGTPQRFAAAVARRAPGTSVRILAPGEALCLTQAASAV
jgi:L-ascorbate metabolism protein UlaG (beta-lactamase superfamily)